MGEVPGAGCARSAMEHGTAPFPAGSFGPCRRRGDRSRRRAASGLTLAAPLADILRAAWRRARERTDRHPAAVRDLAAVPPGQPPRRCEGGWACRSAWRRFRSRRCSAWPREWVRRPESAPADPAVRVERPSTARRPPAAESLQPPSGPICRKLGQAPESANTRGSKPSSTLYPGTPSRSRDLRPAKCKTGCRAIRWIRSTSL